MCSLENKPSSLNCMQKKDFSNPVLSFYCKPSQVHSLVLEVFRMTFVNITLLEIMISGTLSLIDRFSSGAILFQRLWKVKLNLFIS